MHKGCVGPNRVGVNAWKRGRAIEEQVLRRFNECWVNASFKFLVRTGRHPGSAYIQGASLIAARILAALPNPFNVLIVKPLAARKGLQRNSFI